MTCWVPELWSVWNISEEFLWYFSTTLALTRSAGTGLDPCSLCVWACVCNMSFVLSSFYNYKKSVILSFNLFLFVRINWWVFSVSVTIQEVVVQFEKAIHWSAKPLKPPKVGMMVLLKWHLYGFYLTVTLYIREGRCQKVVSCVWNNVWGGLCCSKNMLCTAAMISGVYLKVI